MSSPRAMIPVAVLLLAGLAISPPRAAVAAGHETEVARCIRQSAQGRKWLEVTLWGLRDQEGGWAGAEVRNANGSADLGPMQINSWWVPRLSAMTGGSRDDVRRWLIADICFNVDAARWIFLTGLGETRDYWSAVGAYHSPQPVRRQRYARAVAIAMRARFGADVFTSRNYRRHRDESAQ